MAPKDTSRTRAKCARKPRGTSGFVSQKQNTLTFVECSELCVSRQLFQQPGQAFFVDEGRGLDVLGPDGDLIGGVGGQPGDGVLVDARLHRPHLHAVDAHRVLKEEGKQ